MLPVDKFHSYRPQEDKWYNEKPEIKFLGVKPKLTDSPKLSILISTYNRQAQLQRALECYARQEYQDFEVLLNDDGSTQDIKAIVDKFAPYMNIKYFRTERPHWISCPSKAFRMLYDHAKGDVIVVTHPEIMVSFDGLQFIHDVLLEDKLEDCKSYVIDTPNATNSTWKWVSLRPNFFDERTYLMLNFIDWHSSLDNIQRLGGWAGIGGFAGRPNWKHLLVPGYPWWFVGAALKDCPIWLDTPITEGHANIDMFYCYYRKKHKFLDVVPNKVMCYHQPHMVSAVAPVGEQDNIIPASEGAKCVYDW